MSQDKYIPYKAYLSQVKLRGCQECLTAEGCVFKCLSSGNYPITNWRVQVAKGYEKFKQDVDTKYICLCFSCARKKKYRKVGKKEEKKEEEETGKSNIPTQEDSSSFLFKEKATPIIVNNTPPPSPPVDLPKYCQCGQCNPPVELSYCKEETSYVWDIPPDERKGMVSSLCVEVYRAQQEHLRQLQKEIEKKEVTGEISHDSQFAAVELANLLKQIDGQRKLYKQFFLNKTIV